MEELCLIATRKATSTDLLTSITFKMQLIEIYRASMKWLVGKVIDFVATLQALIISAAPRNTKIINS